MKRNTYNIQIAVAVELFYSKIELCNNDIKKLFNNISDTTVAKLKDQAREHIAHKDVPLFDSKCVNTECAFKAWGLNIDDLEKRYKKLKQLFPEKYSVEVYERK